MKKYIFPSIIWRAAEKQKKRVEGGKKKLFPA
jgi:hypothetical protein